MFNIKIKDTLFPCTDTPEVPYLKFHKNNVYYSNLDPEELKNKNIIPRVKSNSNKSTMGLVLNEIGNPNGWVRINESYQPIPFAENEIYSNMTKISEQKSGQTIDYVNIPYTWVKTEILEEGPYTGKKCYWISDKETEGFHLHPAFYLTTNIISSYLRGEDPYNSLAIQSYLWDGKTKVIDYELEQSGVVKTGSKMTSENNAYYYNYPINCLLARLMMIEFGSPNEAKKHISNYRDIHSLQAMTYAQGGYVSSTNSSGSTTESFFTKSLGGVSFKTSDYINDCYTGILNGIDYGDFFICSSKASSEEECSYGTKNLQWFSKASSNRKNFTLVYNLFSIDTFDNSQFNNNVTLTGRFVRLIKTS